MVIDKGRREKGENHAATLGRNRCGGRDSTTSWRSKLKLRCYSASRSITTKLPWSNSSAPYPRCPLGCPWGGRWTNTPAGWRSWSDYSPPTAKALCTSPATSLITLQPPTVGTRIPNDKLLSAQRSYVRSRSVALAG